MSSKVLVRVQEGLGMVIGWFYMLWNVDETIRAFLVSVVRLTRHRAKAIGGGGKALLATLRK